MPLFFLPCVEFILPNNPMRHYQVKLGYRPNLVLFHRVLQHIDRDRDRNGPKGSEGRNPCRARAEGITQINKIMVKTGRHLKYMSLHTLFILDISSFVRYAPSFIESFERQYQVNKIRS